MNALQYYYAILAPEEQGKSYFQLVHGSKDYIHQPSLRKIIGEEAFGNYLQKISEWQPKYSNDYLLNELMEEFILVNSSSLGDRLRTMFIAKRRTLFANAQALTKSELFDGDIVVFNVGLSDAAYQYSILFQEFIELKKKVRGGDYNAPQRLETYIKMIGKAEKNWSILGGYIKLFEKEAFGEEFDSQRSADIAGSTDRFILAHEISHHLLGHTDEQYKNILDSMHRSKPEGWNEFSKDWQYELDADSLAIGLILGSPRESSEELYVTAALGALLTITIFGQLVENIKSGTETHPPIEIRYANVLSTLRLTDNGFLEGMIKDITNFQRILFRINNRGLGMLHASFKQ